MSKAKYKVGTLVEVGQAGKPAYHAQIYGILTLKDEFQYLTNEPGESPQGEFVHENDIVRAYRPVADKKVKADKANKADKQKKKKMTADTAKEAA